MEAEKNFGVIKLILAGAAVLFFLIVGACSMSVVDTGNRGAYVRFGKVDKEVLPEGLYFVNPFTTHIRELDIKVQKWPASTEAYTRDVQKSTMFFTMTYHLDPTSVPSVIATVGEDWASKLIGQVVIEEIKRETGQHIAVDIVNKRDLAARTIEGNVRRILAKRNVIVDGFQLTNIDFDPAFENAVEAKVINQQKALGEQNKTVQIQELAKQAVATAQGQADSVLINAKAEAESMTIKAKALEQNKSLVEWEAVQKWNGALPVWINDSKATPFISIKPPSQ